MPVPPDLQRISSVARAKQYAATLRLAEELLRELPLKARWKRQRARQEAGINANDSSPLDKAFWDGRLSLSEPWGSLAPEPAAGAAGGGAEDDEALLEALAAKIRAASTDGEREAVAQEAAALVAVGALGKDAAGGIASLLLRAHVSAEMRRRVEPAPEDPTRLLLVSPEALEAARKLDLLVSDDRRARLIRMVDLELEADLVETPNVDEGGAGAAA